MLTVRYSRHARRRMALYRIEEDDVTNVIETGTMETSKEGKVSFVGKLEPKFRYPIKVVGIEEAESFLVITAYPLKKGRK
jgi:hypothetical protein